MSTSNNITLRKATASSKNDSEGSFDNNPLSEVDEVELKRTPSRLSMFMATNRRRSSMLADAKKNSVKCNMPCFDEEDDGIPPFCRHESCPLDHRNKWLNLGSQDGGYADCCVMFGNVGFPWFDRRRGFMMGIATVSTVMAIFITTYGCLSLAKDDGIIKLTYWVRANAYNTTSMGAPPIKLAHEDSFEVYIGLTSMVQRECVPGTGCFESQSHVIEWWKSKDLGQSVNGMDLCRDASKLDHFCDQCRDVAVNSITAAFFACATLLFALYGCINRMKFVSDCPVQKLLGCITDSWGALSLTYALYDFQNQCFWNLPRNIDGYTITYVRGPGIYMYLFCAASGYIRAILHWLTPLPGQGIGCRMQLPTRDRAKETLAAITKWQQDTRQQLEVKFVNVNSQLGQGLNTAIQTSTSGLKTAKDVTVKTTSHLLRSSIAIANSATEVVRRPSWASPSDGSRDSQPVTSTIGALEKEDDNDWEVCGGQETGEIKSDGVSEKEPGFDTLRATAIEVTTQCGPDSIESKQAWKRVFEVSSAQQSTQPPPPPSDNSSSWWSPAGLKKHLGKKMDGLDRGEVSISSVRKELNKLNIGAPTNVHHVVSATVNSLDTTQVQQPGSSFESSRPMVGRRAVSRVSGEGLDVEAGEGALQRLSIGLVNRRPSDNGVAMMDIYGYTRSSSFTASNRPSINDPHFGHNMSMPHITVPNPPSPYGPPPPPPSPVSPQPSTTYRSPPQSGPVNVPENRFAVPPDQAQSKENLSVVFEGVHESPQTGPETVTTFNRESTEVGTQIRRVIDRKHGTDTVSSKMKDKSEVKKIKPKSPSRESNGSSGSRGKSRDRNLAKQKGLASPDKKDPKAVDVKRSDTASKSLHATSI